MAYTRIKNWITEEILTAADLNAEFNGALANVNATQVNVDATQAELDALNISAFIKTLLDDADASAVLSTLGVSAFAKTILDDATAAAARTTLGAAASDAAGIMKGWVVFDGTAGSLSAAASENVASLTDNGTGKYTITWDTDFASANYATAGSAYYSGAQGNYLVTIDYDSGRTPVQAGFTDIAVVNTGGTNRDAEYVSFMAIGEQA